MSKIYCMMGKSSSGKDTLLKAVRKELPCLRTVTPYTTRPIRDGERDGEEYFFVSEEILSTYERQGRVIEQRAYDTVHGIWRYATIDDGQIDLACADYLVIGTLESYRKMRAYYGREYVAPLYIEVEDGERLKREWFSDGVYYRETVFDGEIFTSQYDFRQRESAAHEEVTAKKRRRKSA